jgi:hypothetical protein
MARIGILDYVREAFKVPYNVILVSGGFLAGIASLHPLAIWPLAAALELAYLLSVAHHPRFQNLVRAKLDQRETAGTGQTAERLIAALDNDRRRRFDRVRGRCEELQQSMADAGGETQLLGDLLEGQQADSVNKLLWAFLRTLAYEQMVDRFCAAVPRAEIEANLKQSERETAKEGISPELKSAYLESAEVLKKRLENLERARGNLESLRARLVRIENSVLLIQEQALTRRDPAYVEAEVKAATAGLSSVEEMLSGIDIPALEAPPAGPTPEFVPSATKARERA